MEKELTTDVRLSISIVLHNSPQVLFLRTLESLSVSATVAQRSHSMSEVPVHVIDNSPDAQTRSENRQALAAWPGGGLLRIKYRESGDNRGFGAGHNLATESVNSDFHLILNPDAELAESTLSIGISTLMEDSGIVLLSPEVVGVTGNQEFLCKRYPSFFVLLLRGFSPRILRHLFRRRLHRYEMRDVCSGQAEADVMLATGCFMLLRTESFRAVGGFDERYFLYFEDFDLSLRLGGKGRLVYHPAMKIVHHGGYAARKGMSHVGLFIISGVQFFNQHGWRWI